MIGTGATGVKRRPRSPSGDDGLGPAMQGGQEWTMIGTMMDQTTMMSMSMMSQTYIQSMEKMIVLLQEKTSQPKAVSSDETCTKAEDIKLVVMNDLHLKDDANNIIDYEVRTKLRRINAKQEVFWKKFPRVARPIRYELGLDFLTKDSINTKVIGRIHDRGGHPQYKGRSILNDQFIQLECSDVPE